MRPRVLLLGPTGQLGCDILRAHRESGEPFDLLPLARGELDLAVPGAVERALGVLSFDALVNCAACTKVDEVEDSADPRFCRQRARGASDGAGMRREAGPVRPCQHRLRVRRGAWRTGGPLREDDPTAPVNVYGASKAMGETLARLASDDVVILRAASLFGVAGAGGTGGNFVETMIRAGREKSRLLIVDDQTMSPTATADVARVLVRMLKEGCASGIYHVVNAGSATWFEFAREIIRRAGVAADVAPCATGEYPVRAERPRYSVLDNGKVSAAFGAMSAWQDALDRYLRAKRHLAT